MSSQNEGLTCLDCKYWAGQCKNGLIPRMQRIGRVANSEICGKKWYQFVPKEEDPDILQAMDEQNAKR